MDELRAKELLKKYTDGTATPEERQLVETYFFRYLAKKDALPGEERLLNDQADVRAFLQGHIAPDEGAPIKVRKLWPRIAAAASVLLLLSTGAYFILHKTPAQQTAQNDPEQISPVQKGVVLTIAKGQQIILQQNHNGRIAVMANTQITQTGNILNYQQNQPDAQKQEMQTLTNNSGSKFTVDLADGSEATLDVASSLTYPVAFNANDRRVSMTGQVYFKVKHDTRHNFLVDYRNEETRDIGTEFNINAYDDEPLVKTTLITGAISVRLSNLKTGGLLLKPGEQVIADGDNLKVAPANIEESTAWLQGQMVFHHQTLEAIMRNVARIYNVTVIWKDPETKKLTFGGSVTRSEKLATILNYFRKAGDVDFLVEGKTVTVIRKKK